MNVMKRIIFTLMIMAGLAMVANTVKAQNENVVYGGGTYTYQLDGIKTSGANGEINIEYGGLTEEIIMTSTIVSGDEPTWVIDAEAGSYTASFTIEFSEVVTQATDNLTVTITDLDGTKACSNYINYEITVMPIPTYTLALEASIEETCQVGAGDAANNDNTPEYLGTDIEAEEVTFNVTVTPTISGIIPGTQYTYDYTLAIDNLTGTLLSYGIDHSSFTIDLENLDEGDNFEHTLTEGVGSPSADVFTITFNTTTGLAAQEIEAALEMTPGSAVLSSAFGGIDVNADVTTGEDSDATITVGAVPSIGGFN